MLVINFSLISIISKLIPEIMNINNSNNLKKEIFKKINLYLRANAWIQSNLNSMNIKDNLSCEVTNKKKIILNLLIE